MVVATRAVGKAVLGLVESGAQFFEPCALLIDLAHPLRQEWPEVFAAGAGVCSQ